MCLDSHDMSGGTLLFIWGCNGLAAQNWGYDPNQFTIYLQQSDDDRAVGSPRASTCMDLYSGDYSKGGKIDIWACNGCWNQQWTVGVGFQAEATAHVGSVAVASPTADSPSADARLGDCPPLGPKPKSCKKARFSPAEHAAWEASADTCVGGWPQFADANSLVASPWCQYFQGVYGEVSVAADVVAQCCHRCSCRATAAHAAAAAAVVAAHAAAAAITARRFRSPTIRSASESSE